ncbi:MAG: PilZ domain-containing protein [Tepidisphaeraceae bacterium]
MKISEHVESAEHLSVELDSTASPMSVFGSNPKVDRRRHRRHPLDWQNIPVERWDGPSKGGRHLGWIADLSAGGIRIRTNTGDIRVGAQLRIRLRLPVYAGITPFVSADGSGEGSNEWTGWMTITRVQKTDDNQWHIAGRLVDMREIDRGMLGLYLSAQPLAA